MTRWGWRAERLEVLVRLVEAAGAGWSSLAARRAHNPKVGGSNPSPATNELEGLLVVQSAKGERNNLRGIRIDAPEMISFGKAGRLERVEGNRCSLRIRTTETCRRFRD